MKDQLVYNCQTAWNNCLEIIRRELTEQSFKTWFAPIKAVKLEKDTLTLEVPSPFFYEWLEEYYLHLLKKAIVSELGENGKLEYSIVVDKGGEQNSPLTLKVKNKIPVDTAPNPNIKEHRINNHVSNNKKLKEKKSNKQPLYTTPFNLPELSQNQTDSQLSSLYTFDTFIEGDCNRLARSAGLAIAERPGVTAFNPLVIYGGVGLGKTHLMQAIGNKIKQNHSEKFVLYVSSEQFTTQFIDALKSNNVQNFTNYYLNVDVLIIDDIQFLAGKEKTQENFFHIFNRLHQNGKQIIMSSDQPPRDMKGLQERLLSRFKWGLTADIQTPDYETRIAIVQTKMEAEGVSLPNDIIEYLAYNIDSNIRELEGALISLIASASFLKQEINMELAKRTLLNIIRSSEREITIDFIQQIIADYFNITVEQLVSKTRKKDIAKARQIAMYFSQQYTELSLKDIGKSFGGRDHSTVVHAGKAVTRKSDEDVVYSKMLEDLIDKMEVKK